MNAVPPLTRRRFLGDALALSVASAMPASVRGAVRSPLRIGLTPVFLDDQIGFLERWRRWFEKGFGRPVSFVQRGSYREIIDLVRARQIEFAWLCGWPFLRHGRDMRLVAVPVWRGQPLYRSYLIVPIRDAQTRDVRDLRGRIFAYSDPDSNSGYLYPRYSLKIKGENPASFFSRTFFTWGHRKVVDAVASGLAHGGAVDGYVWETLAELRPDLTSRTRIVERSPEMGHPPFVASASVPADDLRAMRELLRGMAADREGASLLAELRLDGFVDGSPLLFRRIEEMMRAVPSAA